MDDSHKIECHLHGWQKQAFVCQHIVQSLRTGLPVGFHWSSESTSSHPDAWCTECEEARIEVGGEWAPEVEEKLGVKLLCGACYDQAKSIWSNGRKIVH